MSRLPPTLVASAVCAVVALSGCGSGSHRGAPSAPGQVGTRTVVATTVSGRCAAAEARMAQLDARQRAAPLTDLRQQAEILSAAGDVLVRLSGELRTGMSAQQSNLAALAHDIRTQGYLLKALAIAIEGRDRVAATVITTRFHRIAQRVRADAAKVRHAGCGSTFGG